LTDLNQWAEQTFLATLKYNDVGYQKLLEDGYVKRSAHEDLMQDALELWKNGQVGPSINALQPEVLISGTF
jgi:anaphase-promoting complex subunit 4